MNIQNINDSNSKIYSSLNKSISKGVFEQAIKDYADEYLTGLTDEEREKIQKAIKAYLDSIPKGGKVDPNKLNDIVADLLKQYGFKGNIEDMAQMIIGEAETQLERDSSTSEDAAVAYKKLTSSSTSPNFNAQSTPEDSEDEIIRQMITNPDGSKSIVLMKNELIISTIKLDGTGPFDLHQPVDSNAILSNTIDIDKE